MHRCSRIFVGIAVLVVAGCGSAGKSNTYPADAEQSFLAACEKSGSKASCACQLDEYENQYTYEEFKALDTQARGNESERRAAAAKVVEVAQKCSKQQ